ncbi:low molecular weight protein tyrosine phosphatase family protein [Pseudomonas putida]|uniref:Phosphotyrosine protein phosphatase n=1 Tax=Pseudomonas putida TaxID=303 RepID=A0A177SEY6_PSEPU|nr:hypothetical protein [Pseudomonas putida]OAI86056.1 phosphotyrosine protein phosphatase [Pseudomonas putida]
MANLLFVCSRNQWRRPTAEAMWRRRAGFSAHQSECSQVGGAADIRCADVIFVMERKHLQRLQAEYARLLEHKRVHVLDILDDFRYMDPELVSMLEDSVNSYL